MRKKVQTLRHVAILFLTVLIFTTGILIGGDIEQLRVQNLYTQLQDQDLGLQTLVTETQYLDYLLTQNQVKNSTVTCDSVKGSFYSSISHLDDSRLKLEAYINTAKVEEEQYQRLKRYYENMQINYWLLANRISTQCGNLNTILYFYAEKKLCPSCEDQGTHLSYVKAKLGDEVLIFSLDANKQGAIELLAQTNQVYDRELPVLVINDDIYGFLENEAVFEVLNITNN